MMNGVGRRLKPFGCKLQGALEPMVMEGVDSDPRSFLFSELLSCAAVTSATRAINTAHNRKCFTLIPFDSTKQWTTYD